MIIEIEDNDLANGLLGLVVAIVEIVKDTLQLQALRRMEAGSLTALEIDRLGEALMKLDSSIERLKLDLGVAASVQSVRDGLDRAIGQAVDTMFAPLDEDELGRMIPRC